MGSSSSPLSPPPWLGAGEVPHRYELIPEIRPLPLPWYYNQAWIALIAGTAIAALILIGVLAP